MPDNKVEYKRKDEKSASAKLPKTRPIPNKIASFKFPSVVSPELKAKYASRKVQLISKKKLLNRITHNPADDFIGTLKIF